MIVAGTAEGMHYKGCVVVGQGMTGGRWQAKQDGCTALLKSDSINGSVYKEAPLGQSVNGGDSAPPGHRCAAGWFLQ